LKEFKYLRPITLEEASHYLVKLGDRVHILNGGTDLVVRMRNRITVPVAVVDIKHIEELNKISFDEEKGIFIGATVSISEMCQNDHVIEKYPLLLEACSLLGSVQIRNRATCVGNICNASPLADTSTPLLVLGAKVHIYGPNGDREVAIDEFFIGVRKTCLELGEIVKGISIPSESQGFKGAFHKISRRREVDLSTVCASVGKIQDDYRIAFGAVAPTPIRAKNIEAFLQGKTLGEDVIKEAVGLVEKEISPIDDIRASKEYRIDMSQVLLERGLKALLNKE